MHGSSASGLATEAQLERAQELLEHMKVPEEPRVYLLGCLDVRVTLYSQQTRALNLVYALSVTGRLPAGGKIAVIGGGVAAAAGAALKGYDVTLLEQKPRLLHLLAGCDKRWLHPRIYDWPAPDSLRDDTEDLGVLTWSADTASRVAERILAGWASVKARTGDRIREVTGALDVTLVPGSGSTRTVRSRAPEGRVVSGPCVWSLEQWRNRAGASPPLLRNASRSTSTIMVRRIHGSAPTWSFSRGRRKITLRSFY